MHTDPPDPLRDALPQGPAHRRGAGLNPGNRFVHTRLHVDGDERDRRDALPQDDPDHPANRVPLTLYPDATKTVINHVARTSDVPFDWTVNPYRGCEHGCIYCFARPYHEYLGFSPGLDFETKLTVKHDASDLLRHELRKTRWRGEPIVMSAITDVYQPVEHGLRLTRACLEVMAESNQPVSTMTRSALVLRDTDLWQKLAAHNAGRVTVTITTLDHALAKSMEPRAASPSRRLATVRQLARAGVPVSVNIAPVIPGLTDHELPQLLEAIADAGAKRVAWTLLRLPYQVKDLFLDWLQREVHPSRAAKVESLIRQARGGKLYDAGRATRGIDDPTSTTVASRPTPRNTQRNEQATHNRRRGAGPRVIQIKHVFDLYTRKLGLNRDVRPLSSAQFRPPPDPQQMSLF